MERWKVIPKYYGKYEVSDFGRIKSVGRIIGNGIGYRLKETIKLKTGLDKDGYFLFNFSLPNRRQESKRVHILVLECFIRKMLPGEQGCHKDGNKENNALSNLYIGDHESNTLGKYRQGITKLTIDQVREIKSLIGTMYQKDIALLFGVRQSYISRIKTGVRCQFIN